MTSPTQETPVATARAECSDNFVRFRREFLSNWFYQRDGWHRQRLLKGLVGVADHDVSGAIVMPRDRGTTTTLIAFAAWCCLYRRVSDVTLFHHGSRIGSPLDRFERETDGTRLEDGFGFLRRDLPLASDGQLTLHRRSDSRLDFIHDNGRVVSWRTASTLSLIDGPLKLPATRRTSTTGVTTTSLALIDAPAASALRGVARLAGNASVQAFGAGVPLEAVGCGRTAPKWTRPIGSLDDEDSDGTLDRLPEAQ